MSELRTNEAGTLASAPSAPPLSVVNARHGRAAQPAARADLDPDRGRHGGDHARDRDHVHGRRARGLAGRHRTHGRDGGGGSRRDPHLDRDLHRLQPLRAPEPQHLAGHLRRGRRALPRADRRIALLPRPEPGPLARGRRGGRLPGRGRDVPRHRAPARAAHPRLRAELAAPGHHGAPADADRRHRRRGADGGAQDRLAPRVPPRARRVRGRGAARRRLGPAGGAPGRPAAARGRARDRLGHPGLLAAPPTRRRSTCCAARAGPTSTSRSSRASSRSSPRTRRSRSSRACRW